MDVIEYINTITTNSFSDWVRCHNDMLHNYDTFSVNSSSENLDDKEIRIIGHILKVLYNEKISIMNKYYLLVSIEENLEYFIKNENGAINLVQPLTSDLKNILLSKWEYRYTSQLIIVICSTSTYFDLFISSNHQCATFVTGLLSIFFNVITTDNHTTNWTNLKFTVLSSMLHLESCYPTVLSQYESRLADIVQRERSIHFELCLQLYSLVFKNNILNKCRLQRSISFISNTSSEAQVYDNISIVSFMSWEQERAVHEEKIVGNQSAILKSLRTILEQAMAFLSPLAINVVVGHCLTVTKYLSQHNTPLWVPFIARFICSQNLNILEALMSLKKTNASGPVKDSILSGEQLQETLLSVLNNNRIIVAKRQVAAQWLFDYPLDEHIVHSVTVLPSGSDSYGCLFEPELIRHFNLRSFDILEIKYCKLMILNRTIKTSTLSDCNSGLLYSSLKEIIKSLHYFDSDMPSNIMLRVMFAMHIQHSHSVLARDFESTLEGIVVRYPTLLAPVMFYLNALEKRLAADEQSRNFSVKCLTQISRLSSEKLLTLTDFTDFTSIRLHIHVLNYAVKFTDIDMTEYLVLLYELLASCKKQTDIKWFEEAYNLVLDLCFNIIKKYGSSKFYQEIANILNEIRNELLGNSTEIKANFLYALIVSLPSAKIEELLSKIALEEINEKDFELISASLLENHLDDCKLSMERRMFIITTEGPRYQFVDSLEDYFDFLRNHQFTPIFDVELRPKAKFVIEKFLYGISVTFATDSHFSDISPWQVAFIRCTDGNNFSIRQNMEVIVKEPESFSVLATLTATKLDGTFVVYSIETELIELMELALEIPIQFSSSHSKKQFINELLKDKLLARSFVSIDFKDEIRLSKFHNFFDRFIFTKDDEMVLYLLFLPPHNHILIAASTITTYATRFNVCTDLKMINLLSIEQYLKHFEE